MDHEEYIGLTDSAFDFVADMKDRPDLISSVVFTEDGSQVLGIWESLETGIIYKEIVQEVFWAPNPMIFTCLQDDIGEKLFKWNPGDRFDRYAGTFKRQGD